MKPILFTIGTFNVYAFGFFLFLAFLFATFIVFEYAKQDFKEEEYFDAFLYSCVASVISARIGYILTHFQSFQFIILRYILVRETPGLSLTAGMIGGCIFLYWYTHAKKLPFVRILDIFSIAAAFALFLSRIGQILGGGGFGKETSFFLAVRLAGKAGRFHPVELYESVLFLLVFILLSFLYTKAQKEKWPQGLTGCIFVLSTSLIIFLLEFLKVNSVYLYGLSFRHISALVVFILILKPTISRVMRIAHMGKQKHL